MTRNFGQEYPERTLMSTISDLLGIAHYSTSRGGTVRSDFLVAVCGALGVENPMSGDKDAKIRHMWEAANKRDMPAELLSVGGTVTNNVLQGVVDGILQNGLAPAKAHSDLDFDPAVVVEFDPQGEFDPDGIDDTRRSRIIEQAVRDGQSAFRDAVLDAYIGKCAITGTDVPAVLDAAHIHEYKGRETNVTSNGIALRTDLHRLFDRHLITIHEVSLKVVASPLVSRSRGYAAVDGASVFIPRAVADRPSRGALVEHRRQFDQLSAHQV